MQCTTWEAKKNRAMTYLHSLNNSLEKSRQFVYFLDLLAQKDILIASYASGKEGRHIVAPYLNISSNKLDISFIECCLFLDFTQDLTNCMMHKIKELDLVDIRKMIADIREKTDDVFLLRFLQILNRVNCQKDYIDDVFLDCPIDTPDFQQEERKFCQELFEKKNYLVLYDYLTTREQIDDIASILRRDKKDITDILWQNLNLGSLLLLLSDKTEKTKSYFEVLIETLTCADMNIKMKNICIFICCLNSCIVLEEIPETLKDELKKLICDSEYLLKYRKYIGHEEISCFKKLLSKDIKGGLVKKNFLLEFLTLISNNNTFSDNFVCKESMKPLANKNKKYLRDNKNFSEQLDLSQYSEEEKVYIRKNTHLRMYTGFLTEIGQ